MNRQKCEVFRDIPDTNYQIGCFGNIRNKKNGRIKVPFDRNRTGYIRALSLKNAKLSLNQTA